MPSKFESNPHGETHILDSLTRNPPEEEPTNHANFRESRHRERTADGVSHVVVKT